MFGLVQAVLVAFAHGLQLLFAGVPAHIDHEDVERRGVVVEAADDLLNLLVAVVPVARPPCAEGEARRNGNATGDFDVVAEGFAVVVAVAEEVQVLSIAGGTFHDPRPWALLAFFEGEVCGIEERPCRVVDERPAGA